MNEEKEELRTETAPFLLHSSPETSGRNAWHETNDSSIIHYYLPSISYLGMLYDPRGKAPRNLSDGSGLRLDEGKGMRAVDYDVRRTFFL